jgi:hypothetical protein
VADRGYSSDAFGQHICDLGVQPVVPSKCSEAPVYYPDWAYASRRLVENLWAGSEEWRAVAAHHEKTARSFLGVLYLAAAVDWLMR